ncbi:MAG TPA: HIRAN domain-containing protein [Rhizomicrobium sp.]|jgi:hypothetical protein
MIQHVYEPTRLVLAWQAPDECGNRARFAVGEITKKNNEYVLRYYANTPDLTKACDLGYQGYPAFSLKQPEHTKGVLDAFMRRLPPRSRPDFIEYLKGLRLTPFADLSDFALLGYSEAKLPSDGFSLVDTLEDKKNPFELLLEIAGYRHHSPSLVESDIGSAVTLVPEPTNPYDPNAIAVVHQAKIIGYINRLQAPAMKKWLVNNQLTSVLEKLNGKPTKPRAFIFLWVN